MQVLDIAEVELLTRTHRARLKEIPDNLIFHLKRFDFNLRTLQRSKINDYYSFPEAIDMHPYTISAAHESDIGNQDLFELVGVLVHSGTAESGHYYSYIRERPSTRPKHTWVEFNDEIVSSWDIKSLETCCFGGPDACPGGDSGFDKSYSAYMLFYQRTSAVTIQQLGLEKANLKGPVYTPIPDKLMSIIAAENELTMRKYCLYEPAQTVFMSRMLSIMRSFNNTSCTSSHDREKGVLQTVFNHLDQVVARTKDLPQFAGYLNAIKKVCQRCAECSRDYIDWYCGCSEALRMLLVRNPDAAARSEISVSILVAFKKIKADATYAYGFDDDVDSMDDAPPQIILHFADGLLRLYETFHQNIRAWPEYFGLLNDIADLGPMEVAVLLDRDFLRKTLLIVCADPFLPIDPQYQKMWSNITKRMATRPVSYEAIIALLCRLLESCDCTLDPVIDNGNRLSQVIEGNAVALTYGERHLLVQQWTRSESNILVEKLLRINQNDFAVQSIIRWLLKWSANTGEELESSIHRAILGGLQKPSSALPARPWLRAALTYCEHGEATNAIRNTIEEVSRAAATDNASGVEFANFYRDVIELVENKSNTTQAEIFYTIVSTVGLWAPNLLTSYESSVRTSTESLVRDLILDQQDHCNFEDDDDERSQMILNGIRSLGVACLDFIQQTYLQDHAAAVQATLFNIRVVLEECSSYFPNDDPFHRRYNSMAYRFEFVEYG